MNAMHVVTCPCPNICHTTLVKGGPEIKSARQELMATTFGIARCNQNDHKICGNRFFITSLVSIYGANSSLLQRLTPTI